MLEQWIKTKVCEAHATREQRAVKNIDGCTNSLLPKRQTEENRGPSQFVAKRKMPETLEYLVAYHQSGRSLVCERDKAPYYCEFWGLDELEQINHEYQVPKYAPGYLGFATSGGGELFAVSPSGSVVCLPFIGMEPEAALEIAPDWSAFTRALRNAL